MSIPIETAKRVAQDHDCKQVILVAWDGKETHVVTYGDTLEACDQAAQGGNRVKSALGWPGSLNAEPSRVTTLKNERAKLRSALAGMIGVDGKEDLEKMESVLRMSPAPAEDKAQMIDALHALRDTL